MVKRRKWKTPMAAAGLALWLVLGRASALPQALDLAAEAAQARRDCVPLLLEFATTSCEWCQLLEREVLDPTRRNPDYRSRAHMRKLLLDGDRMLRDFDGSLTAPQHLAARYRVELTPTVLFLDTEGQELAERLVGVGLLDFYGAYLDRSLEQAAKALRETGRCAAAGPVSSGPAGADAPPAAGAD
ncbi:MAG TPA: hypothetical protein ENJ79_03545 [Gammaproteobacteria bacterium]|nr:hypothetical protein [Gammaproteobacteria bacterium]